MDELLMCSVCIERYHEKHRQPVLLPRCGHSFCRSCVAMLLAGGCIVCPTCRNDQRIDSAEKLPTEYTLLAIIQAQEDSSKETCERHGVKLSFWCRSCAQATCGECLFEDHPTHTHDVTKASKYINEMKQNAYDIAVKFMEVLDEREQSFYKSIFHSVKKISNALRNVTALRKDMEEARELMKGIKEEDSIKSATALSEAAKFLGLKWNIQDANFLQREAEEKAKGDDNESAKTDKERILEEEIEREKEKTKEETKEGKGKEGDKEKPKSEKEAKELKRALRKSKTMSSLEMATLAEKMGDKDLLKKLESISELPDKDGKKDSETVAKPTKEIQIPKPTKPRLTKKVLAERLAALTPESLKIEDASSKSPATAEDSKTTSTPTAEDSKTTSTPTAEDSKSMENSNAESAKNPEEAKMSEELKILAENTKNSAEKELRSLSPTLSVASVASSSLTDAKEEAEDELDLAGVIEKLQEEIKLLKEGSKPKEGEGETKAAAEPLNADSGLSEDSKASKVKNESAQAVFETKLMDCIQVPGFMLGVEAEDGRLGEVTWGPQGLHIHCLQFNSVQYDICIKTNILNTMIPSMNPIAFLELSAEQKVIGRVYIRLGI